MNNGESLPKGVAGEIVAKCEEENAEWYATVDEMTNGSVKRGWIFLVPFSDGIGLLLVALRIIPNWGIGAEIRSYDGS